MRTKEEILGGLRLDLQYGVQLRGESFVRLQPDLRAAEVRVETTPGAILVVHNPRTGEWEIP